MRCVMYTSFTDWDSEIHLAHHGKRGMKWGERRYQNQDGSLTELGREHYGIGKKDKSYSRLEKRYNAKKDVSARKMQRDFNRLDRKFAKQANYAKRKAADALSTWSAIGGYISSKKYTSAKQAANDETVKYFGKKYNKLALQANLANERAKSIESLQTKILDRASKKGYTVSSKAVVRHAVSGRQIARDIWEGHSMRNYSQIYGIRGNKVKIRRKGDGSVKLAVHR